MAVVAGIVGALIYVVGAFGMLHFSLEASRVYLQREVDEDDEIWAVFFAVFWPMAWLLPVLMYIIGKSMNE